MGLIYKATNTVNGKMYVGKTVKSLARRKTEHQWYANTRNGRGSFASAIRKYGNESFRWEVIEDGIDSSLLNEKESYHISLNSSNVYGVGYNQTSGGDGAPYGDLNPSKRQDVKDKLRVANTGYKHTKESLIVMSEKSREYYKNGMPESQRKKISESQIGRFVPKGSGNHLARTATLTDATGIKHSFSGIREFALLHGLDHSCISKLLNGKLKTHKGWTA